MENSNGKRKWARGKLRRLFATTAVSCGLLTGAGYGVHLQANTYLEGAALHGVAPAVKPLVWLGADQEGRNKALWMAAYAGQTGAAAELLKVGVSREAVNDALLTGATHGRTETVRLLLDGGANVRPNTLCSALFEAAANGHSETVTLLLDRGVDVHAIGDSALNEAIRFGHTETAKILRERGAKDPKPLRFTGQSPDPPG